VSSEETAVHMIFTCLRTSPFPRKQWPVSGSWIWRIMPLEPFLLLHCICTHKRETTQTIINTNATYWVLRQQLN